MSTDREEVRWKFQVLFEAMNQSLGSVENERREFQENLWKNVTELKEIRNNWLAGVAFGIGILVSLISLGILGKENVWYIIIGMITGIVIFVGYNLYMTKKYHLHALIGQKYWQINVDFSNLKGIITGLSLHEEISKEDVVLLAKFVFVIGQSSIYELQYYAYNMVKMVKPRQEDFTLAYKTAKENISDFQKLSLGGYAKRIELFISAYEKNEK